MFVKSSFGSLLIGAAALQSAFAIDIPSRSMLLTKYSFKNREYEYWHAVPVSHLVVVVVLTCCVHLLHSISMIKSVRLYRSEGLLRLLLIHYTTKLLYTAGYDLGDQL